MTYHSVHMVPTPSLPPPSPKIEVTNSLPSCWPERQVGWVSLAGQPLPPPLRGLSSGRIAPVSPPSLCHRHQSSPVLAGVLARCQGWGSCSVGRSCCAGLGAHSHQKTSPGSHRGRGRPSANSQRVWTSTFQSPSTGGTGPG